MRAPRSIVLTAMGIYSLRYTSQSNNLLLKSIINWTTVYLPKVLSPAVSSSTPATRLSPVSVGGLAWSPPFCCMVTPWSLLVIIHRVSINTNASCVYFSIFSWFVEYFSFKSGAPIIFSKNCSALGGKCPLVISPFVWRNHFVLKLISFVTNKTRTSEDVMRLDSYSF